MDFLYKIISQHSVLLLGIALLLLIMGLLWVFLLSRRLNGLRRRWRELLDGTSGQDVEHLLRDHLRERLALQAEVAAARERIERLEELMGSAKRHLGIVRYDAFQDVGGEQSFALALFDDRGDGAVVTGLIGRNDSRVYCKRLINGRAERNLSEEEQRAVRDATSSGPKPIVSS
jgi:hypothetical protein